MNNLRGKVIFGSVIHSPNRGKVELLKNALLLVNPDGKVFDLIERGAPSYYRTLNQSKSMNSLYEISSHQYIIPGFTDLHIHAPQWPQLGKSLDVPLEVWLQKYTFPLEAKYQDEEFAKIVYSDLVASLLKAGTTTAVYYGTIHQKANQILADICLNMGQRAIIGKVVMDNPDECPEYYRDMSTDAALTGTSEFLNYVKNNDKNTDKRVDVAITPRFIPSCTDEVLYELGRLAERHSVYVQTHCSESDWEHNYVINRCGKSDTEALMDYGLLNRSTILAHANFISETDMELIKKEGAGIAHCPLSNFFFSDAVFPLRRALEKGLRVGLGTDIAGGPSVSIFDVGKTAIVSARALENGVNPNTYRDKRGCPHSRIDFADAFYLATKGGADVLNILAGSFEKENYFDALLIDTEIDNAKISIQDGVDQDEDIIQKMVMLATRSNILKTWVGGLSV